MTERKRKGVPDEVFNVFSDGFIKSAAWTKHWPAEYWREENKDSARPAYCVTHRIRVYLKHKETTDDPAR